MLLPTKRIVMVFVYQMFVNYCNYGNMKMRILLRILFEYSFLHCVCIQLNIAILIAAWKYFSNFKSFSGKCDAKKIKIFSEFSGRRNFEIFWILEFYWEMRSITFEDSSTASYLKLCSFHSDFNLVLFPSFYSYLYNLVLAIF
jgi:hypothetical protein